MAIINGSAVLFANSSQTSYDNLSSKVDNTIYFTSDTHNIYLGSDLLTGNVIDATYDSGVLTITRKTGDSVVLDFSDIASASAVGTAIKDAIDAAVSTAKTYTDTTATTLIGASTDETTANTIWAAKNYADAAANVVDGKVDTLTSQLNALVGDDDATDAIDTFNEIVSFLDGLENTSDTLSDIISTIDTGLDSKVDKVDGSSLMTTEQATKLSGIESGAQVNNITSVSITGGTGSIANNVLTLAITDQVGSLESDLKSYADSAASTALTSAKTYTDEAVTAATLSWTVF